MLAEVLDCNYCLSRTQSFEGREDDKRSGRPETSRMKTLKKLIKREESAFKGNSFLPCRRNENKNGRLTEEGDT